MLVALLAAGCAASDPEWFQVCGSRATASAPACPEGFECRDGSCEVHPTRLWTLSVDHGVVPDSWDWLGPDATVCAREGDALRCTQEASNTTTASWDGCWLRRATATELVEGIWMSVYDNDRPGIGACREVLTVRPGKVLCAEQRVRLGKRDFADKSWTLRCGDGVEIHGSLTPFP